MGIKARSYSLLLTIATVCLLWSTVVCQARIDDGSVDIPYKKFILDNGLTLIVHEDHKVPIVSVSVWYHVGSKNEKPGRTGLAHLFEHLMFKRSEHSPDDYVKFLTSIGANAGGGTSYDATAYIQTASTSTLDTMLWMESDRMGHLLGAVTQENLEEQLGVVINEKSERESQPFFKAFMRVLENAYPKGHPYSWPVIGYVKDLEAVSMEDVHNWFKEYYGAANAVVCIVGDVDTELVKAKVEKYFGDIQSGPPVERHGAWVEKRTGMKRMRLEERVPQAMIFMDWNIPPLGDTETNRLYLVGQILAGGKSSRLYRRLVIDERIATDVKVMVLPQEVSGQFDFYAFIRPGSDLARVEESIKDELAKFISEGPTEEELEGVKALSRGTFIRQMEKTSFKAETLASGAVLEGDPDAYKKKLRDYQLATADDLKRAAGDWLSDGLLVLEIHPFPNYKAAGSGADRSQIPAPGETPDAKFPALQRAALSNGLEVILAERHSVPIVEFRLVLDAGNAADLSFTPGTSRLVMSMLLEGTSNRTAEGISSEQDALAARIRAVSGLDISHVSLSALKENLDASLELFADVVINPSFPQPEFELALQQNLAWLRQAGARPLTSAYLLVQKLLFGDGHAYSYRYTGAGSAGDLTSIERGSLIRFHKTWFKPGTATMIVVGDTTMDEVIPKLEKLFGVWEPGDAPEKVIDSVEPPGKTAVYIIDRPGSPQSVVVAAKLLAPRSGASEHAIRLSNSIVGGQFTARINMNLREARGWTYGAYSFIHDARGQRILLTYAPVQADKTSETMAEIHREFSEFAGDNVATQEELDLVMKAETLKLTERWETCSAVVDSITEIIQFGLPDSCFENYAGSIRAVTLEDVRNVSKDVFVTEGMIWVVVGDGGKIIDGIKELGLGEVVVCDIDGNPIN